MQGFALDTCTKWWGPDRHIILYPVNARRDETYFTTAVPDPVGDLESWSAQGNVADVRRALLWFLGDDQKALAACPQVHKWAPVYRRAPARSSHRALALL